MKSSTSALRTLLVVASRGGVTVSELARELGSSTSTAHRILHDCRSLGFVRQDHAGGRYLPGQALHELALSSTSATGLRDAAMPALESLRDSLGETVSLIVLEGRHVRFVQVLEGSSSVRVGSRLGRTFPAHTISGGKAMLALGSLEWLEQRYPGRHLERLTDRTTVRWDTLLAELEVIRHQGWAMTQGESDPDISGVGAAVRLGTGEAIAAISVAVPSSRLRAKAEARALAPSVTSAAEAIQLRIRG
jgi:IclR family transcriptional regulator, acetate operon repressor